MTPKTLKTMTDAEFKAAYDPATFPLFKVEPTGDLVDIVIYPPPAFLFSPRTRAYWAKDIVHAKGWLSKFEPVGMETGEPEATITITTAEMK